MSYCNERCPPNPACPYRHHAWPLFCSCRWLLLLLLGLVLQGDWAPAFGGGKKRRGGGGGGKKGGKQAEPTEEELQAMAEEVEAEAMEDDGDG